MGLFDGCLLASDVDDTLVDNGYINPANIEKIDFFMNEGGMFSLSSGRGSGALLPVLEKLNNVSPCVTTNGTVIYDYKNSIFLSQKFIPKSDYAFPKKIGELDRNIAIEIHCGFDILVTAQTQEGIDHQVYERLNPIMVSYEEACQRNWNKVLYMCETKQDREFIKEFVSKENSMSDFVETSAVIYGRMRYYFEQIPKDVSKFTALKELCEILNVKKGGLFAIGDYYNDVEMLKNADISASPCESPENVKKYADYITVSCKDGAVADFIDYLTERLK